MRLTVRPGYQMTAKQYLFQLTKINRELAILNEEIEVRRASLTSITAPLTGDRVQTSTKGDTFATMIAALVDKEYEQAELVAIYQTMRDKIVDQILKLDDELFRDVLYERYVKGLDWNTIAGKLYYNKKYLFKVHTKALAAFTEKYDLR